MLLAGNLRTALANQSKLGGFPCSLTCNRAFSVPSCYSSPFGFPKDVTEHIFSRDPAKKSVLFFSEWFLLFCKHFFGDLKRHCVFSGDASFSSTSLDWLGLNLAPADGARLQTSEPPNHPLGCPKRIDLLRFVPILGLIFGNGPKAPRS